MEKKLYLWTEAEYSRHVAYGLNGSGKFETRLDILNTTHENALEVIEWAKADGFNAEIDGNDVRIWRD